MKSSAYRTVKHHWAEILDCDSSAILSDGTTVTPWDEDAIEFLVWPDGAVVGVPPDLFGEFRERIPQLPFDLDRDGARRWVEPIAAIEEVLGPQFVGYCDSSTFTPVESKSRQVDSKQLVPLKEACPSEEWFRSAVQIDDTDRPTFAVFADDQPVAAAQFSTVHGIAGIATISHPQYRGEGYATAAVSRAVTHALERDLLPEYRTVERWRSSVALADHLGFEQVAKSLLVQLNRES